MIRQDKFKVGDKVRLTSKGHYKQTALGFQAQDYSWLKEDGIYTIKALEDIGDGNSAVGHTQLVALHEDFNSTGKPNWSGAYWELVE